MPRSDRRTRARPIARIALVFFIQLERTQKPVIHGAPVTTLDFDFLFEDIPRNRSKLVRVAKELGAMALRPYYLMSSLFRVTDDDLTMQINFVGAIHGLRFFEGARKRATTGPVIAGGRVHRSGRAT
jgi:hypothetical protein